MRKGFAALLVMCLTATLVAACLQPAPTPAPATAAAPTSAPKDAPTAVRTAAQTPVPSQKAASPSPKAEATSAGRPYFQGKTLEFLVSDSAGGGTDTMARIVAPFFTKYVPGNPQIILRNQPGASGVVGNNSFYTKARADGTNIAVYGSSIISMQLRNPELVQYDVTKYRHIGYIQRSANVMMIRKGQKARLTDPRAEPLVVGTKEGEEAWNALLIWGKEQLGWNVRWILGFAGTAEMELALRRGESDIFITSNAYAVNNMIQSGVAEPFLTMGTRQGDKFARRPDFPDVPTFDEILGSKAPTGVSKQAYMAWIGSLLVDKGVVAPPKTPDNVVEILRDAFVKAAADPVFDEKVKKLVSEVYSAGTGKEGDAQVKELIETPPAAMDYAVQLQKKFGIKQ